MDDRINKWTGRFESKSVEDAFVSFVFEGNFKNNFYALALAIPIFACYAILDGLMINEAKAAITYRLVACSLGGAILLGMRFSSFSRQQEWFSCLILIILSTTLFFIVFTQPALDNTYYVGLVQGGVFVCFLLRVSFLKSIAVLGFYLIGFSLSVAGKTETSEAYLQIIILITMFLICGFGNYLLQRYRRNDFLKTQTIKHQNAQLQALLEDVRLDNTRKLAAINTLVHFVKTPLHQISGYSDIVMSSLSAGGAESVQEQGIEGARYIKEATTNLNNSVNALLTYHRLDEAAGKAEREPVSLSEMLSDLKELAEEHTEIEVEGDAYSLRNREDVLRTAFTRLANFFEENESKHVKVEFLPLDDDGVATLVINEDGKTLSQEEFEEAAKPLTKIDTYLTANGNEMPMALRTAARAFEICGGALCHEECAEGNKFIITMRDFSAPGSSQLRAAS